MSDLPLIRLIMAIGEPPFARNAVDLMSLVSHPLVGTPWHYRFFLEVAAAASEPRMVKALAELEARTVELRVFGSYRSGK